MRNVKIRYDFQASKFNFRDCNYACKLKVLDKKELGS